MQHIVHEESKKVYKVGREETKSSMGTIKLPCTVGGKCISMKLNRLRKSAIKQTKIKMRVLNDTTDIFVNRVELKNTCSSHSCLFVLEKTRVNVKECNIMLIIIKTNIRSFKSQIQDFLTPPKQS